MAIITTNPKTYTDIYIPSTTTTTTDIYIAAGNTTTVANTNIDITDDPCELNRHFPVETRRRSAAAIAAAG